MDMKPSTHEQGVATNEQNGVSNMELTKAQELIERLKEVKAKDEISYPRLMDRMEKNGKFVSLTTLRRVFADGSEQNAGSFNYESTLMPIAEVLLNVEEVPTLEDSPCADEINGLKAIIHIQAEEIARLHDMKDHLEDRITFLLEQISLKDSRMDAKDVIIQRLMDKCL